MSYLCEDDNHQDHADSIDVLLAAMKGDDLALAKELRQMCSNRRTSALGRLFVACSRIQKVMLDEDIL